MRRLLALTALVLTACAGQQPIARQPAEIETRRAIGYDYDILIKGGTVYDGSGGKPYVADIGVKDGLINAVYPTLKGDAAVEIDARGKAVAPGFIGSGDLAHGFTTQCEAVPAPSGEPLPETIRELTSTPAGKLGLKERGRIMPGWAADLAVFQSRIPQPGVTEAEDVVVGGRLAMQNHQPTGGGASHVLNDGCRPAW
jgi:N-acyl-D-aspartate/D-glutamate deacylase